MISVRVELKGIETMTRMEVVNSIIRALAGLGEWWVNNLLPKRFDARQGEYGFRPRSRKYQSAKLRHGRSPYALVNTGAGRDEALDSLTLSKIRATRDKLIIPLPTKFNLHNPKGPRLPDEVRAVTHAELQQMQDLLVEGIDFELNQIIGDSGESRVDTVRLKSHNRPRSYAPAAIVTRRAA